MEQSLAGHSVTLIGGAGFMGHHLAFALKARGADVLVIDSLQVNNLLQFSSQIQNTPHRTWYLKMINERLDLMREAGIVLNPVDARDYHLLARTFDNEHCEVIIQLAAVSHAGNSNKDPLSTFDHSLRTLENALDVARGRCKHFIYLSSSMVYGNFLTPSVAENHPLEPIGIYGALKLAGEKLVIAYNQVFDLPYTIIRPSALYGARCVSRRVSQIFIENAIHGRPMCIEGEGTERLDFTYIDDLVDGISRVVLNEKAINDVFNLTYGESRTVGELVDVIRKEFPDVPVEKKEWDRLMPHRGTLNIDKARDRLGYAPSHPIEVGIPKYISWYKKFFEEMSKSASR